MKRTKKESIKAMKQEADRIFNEDHQKKTTKKGLKQGKCYQKLTPTEAEVLHLLTKEFLTPNKAAIRRKTSKQAIYKIIKNLKEKGFVKEISKAFKQVEKIQSTLQPTNLIRLHGQEFNIKILYKDYRYKKILEKANTLNIDGNTIRLYRNSIEVYLGHSFFGDTCQKATARSFTYWNRLVARLENDLKLILVKPGSQNIKIVAQHYAEINNELAEECEKTGDKIRIYTTDEGKLWFMADKSFNENEIETQGKTAKRDMEDVVQPFFNDLRDYPDKPPKLSDIMNLLGETNRINRETASGLNVVVQLIKDQNKPKENNFKKDSGDKSYFG